MNSDEEIAMPNEVVIVRRRPCNDDEGGHGGAWKIAYADFMTAMMAFFLVMWIISSSDDKTIAQIANYFNPIQLNDRVRSTKGLNDADAKSRQQGEGEKKEKSGTQSENNKKVNDDLAEGSENELFADPYGLLAKIATNAEKDLLGRAPPSDDASKGRGVGKTLRDPFASNFSRGAPGSRKNDAPSEGNKSSPTLSSKLKPAADKKKSGGQLTLINKSKLSTPNISASDQSVPDISAPDISGMENLHRAVQVAEESKLRRGITDALKALSFDRQPFIEVKRIPEGLLIAVTDQFDFGMFDIASAKPRPELVLVMGQLAKVILDRQEQLVVRGHTDGRPFRSKHYDNWRLATARAHMTRYMLVRGGIPEDRFSRVEGHADRMLMIANNPLAAQNRRIEILLLSSKP